MPKYIFSAKDSDLPSDEREILRTEEVTNEQKFSVKNWEDKLSHLKKVKKDTTQNYKDYIVEVNQEIGKTQADIDAAKKELKI